MFERSHTESFDPAFANEAIGFRNLTLAPSARERITMRSRRPFVALLVLTVTAGSHALGQTPFADEWLGKPVDDRTFKTYLEFFAYVPARPARSEVDGLRGTRGHQDRALMVSNMLGVRVAARLYQPPGAERGKPATLILLHGGGPNGKEGPGILRVALNLARAGWQVFAIDMPYFGERHTDLLTTFTKKRSTIVCTTSPRCSWRGWRRW